MRTLLTGTKGLCDCTQGFPYVWELYVSGQVLRAVSLACLLATFLTFTIPRYDGFSVVLFLLYVGFHKGFNAQLMKCFISQFAPNQTVCLLLRMLKFTQSLGSDRAEGASRLRRSVLAPLVFVPSAFLAPWALSVCAILHYRAVVVADITAAMMSS